MKYTIRQFILTEKSVTSLENTTRIDLTEFYLSFQQRGEVYRHVPTRGTYLLFAHTSGDILNPNLLLLFQDSKSNEHYVSVQFLLDQTDIYTHFIRYLTTHSIEFKDVPKYMEMKTMAEPYIRECVRQNILREIDRSLLENDDQSFYYLTDVLLVMDDNSPFPKST